ncbi:MAG: CvpA family protein, partial [Actinomycetota bacterium]
MLLIDLTFILLLALSAVGGYRRGAIVQVFGLLGLVAAVVFVLLIAPLGAALEIGTTARALIVVALVVGTVAFGSVLGHAIGVRIRRRTLPEGPSRPDSVLGSGISVVALIVATWFLVLNLAQGPFPDLATSIRGSGVVRLMDRVLPPPPALVPTLRATADRFGFEDVFVGLPPVPGPPVDDPAQAEVDRAGRAGLASSIEVLGRGCIPDYFNQGSGFVVAPGYVVTNAHVVAGTHGQFLYDGERYPATVVAIDIDQDLAILFAPTYRAAPLPLALEELPRG